LLIASFERRTHVLSLGGFIPVRCCRYRSAICREADQHSIAFISLAQELSDIQLAALSHLRRACITQMRVMFPDDDLCRRSTLLQMFHQFIECLSHVRVAKV